MQRTSSLSERRKQFCREYVVDFNAARAAKAAGYSEITARAAVYRMLYSPVVAAEIQRLIDARAERTRISADRVVLELAAVAFSSVADCRITSNGGVELAVGADPLALRAVAAVKCRERSRGADDAAVRERTTALRLWDKLTASQLLMRHLGMLPPLIGGTRRR